MIVPDAPTIRASVFEYEELSLSQEWAWAAAIAAIPVIIFCAAEVYALMRRRRLEAIARRPKENRRRSGSGRNR
ncbi:MAG TPA: hypothetical protein VEC11_06490 [Allosphingosinicella sp.]|nr:hypothetical protein [Allosphingosinicella sp.]